MVERNAHADTIIRVSTLLLQSVVNTGLYTRQNRLCSFQCRQTAVTALLRLLCTGDRIIDGTAHRAGKGKPSARFSSAQIFRPQYDGHAPGQPPHCHR